MGEAKKGGTRRDERELHPHSSSRELPASGWWLAFALAALLLWPGSAFLIAYLRDRQEAKLPPCVEWRTHTAGMVGQHTHCTRRQERRRGPSHGDTK